VFSGEVKKAEVFQGSEDLKMIGTSIFYVLIFFAIMVVILGVLGAITARCYNRWCSACVSYEKLNSCLVWTLGNNTGNICGGCCRADIVRRCKLSSIN
jgi:hypothetical protein